MTLRKGTKSALPSTKLDPLAIIEGEGEKSSPPAHLVPKPSTASWNTLTPNPNIFKNQQGTEPTEEPSKSPEISTSKPEESNLPLPSSVASSKTAFMAKPLSFISKKEDSLKKEEPLTKEIEKEEKSGKAEEPKSEATTGVSAVSTSSPVNPFGGFKFSQVNMPKTSTESPFKNSFGKPTVSSTDSGKEETPPAAKKWTFMSQNLSSPKTSWQPPPLSHIFNKPAAENAPKSSMLNLPLFGKNIPPPKESNIDPSVKAAAQASQKSSTPAPLLSGTPVQSGEENDNNLFSAEAKLFEFDPERRQWIERGVGVFQLNQLRTEPTKTRIVMHANVTLKLLLNSPIFASMVCEPWDKQPVRIKLTALAPAKPAQTPESTPSHVVKIFSLRFRDPEIASSAVQHLKQAIKEKASLGESKISHEGGIQDFS